MISEWQVDTPRSRVIARWGGLATDSDANKVEGLLMRQPFIQQATLALPRPMDSVEDAEALLESIKKQLHCLRVESLHLSAFCTERFVKGAVPLTSPQQPRRGPRQPSEGVAEPRCVLVSCGPSIDGAAGIAALLPSGKLLLASDPVNATALGIDPCIHHPKPFQREQVPSLRYSMVDLASPAFRKSRLFHRTHFLLSGDRCTSGTMIGYGEGQCGDPTHVQHLLSEDHGQARVTSVPLQYSSAHVSDHPSPDFCQITGLLEACCGPPRKAKRGHGREGGGPSEVYRGGEAPLTTDAETHARLEQQLRILLEELLEWLGCTHLDIPVQKGLYPWLVEDGRDASDLSLWTVRGILEPSQLRHMWKALRERVCSPQSDQRQRCTWGALSIWSVEDAPVAFDEHPHGYDMCGAAHSHLVCFSDGPAVWWLLLQVVNHLDATTA
ncbi:unnamed protein product [Vitrella brassicaformis CCMP3155]|uniref:Uncharacterized protein n=1 Tax=Vitrella brassicaformis (strain CCMP3155) TaxID=1169540 RepID=A0A0G4FM71_VITBC|nr:unnamed protein product [Vitrella brassicaformis CCMP3155]|eukprot:CEM15075.1 unnamed protein product [Vitrella brassicaformis CCMP3155]